MFKSGSINRDNRLRYEISNQFKPAEIVIEHKKSLSIVHEALDRWKPKSKQEAKNIFNALEKAFPNEQQIDSWWDNPSDLAFRDFFIWGHDHDFGYGLKRKGSMTTRHIEITSESMALGFLPSSLKNKQVLNIGPWSGGDLLVLAGLGGDCVALEENLSAAKAASFLMDKLKIKAAVIPKSVYEDQKEWRSSFDYIYCSGVIYHVTDPLLFLRILFCYLKIGGEILLETKAIPGNNALCGYSGISEKGWNWYAPDELTLGRWFLDAGFQAKEVSIFRRSNGRLLGHAVKTKTANMIETAGFSRPGSWLEKES